VSESQFTSRPGIKDWSLTTLKEKLIKIGAKVISHSRYVAFQMAEVAIPKNLFANILRLIAELRPRLHKDQVRASVLRRHGRHCGAHPERPGLVSRGRDDATLARPADRNRFAAQLRIVATADFPDLFVANSCHAVFGLLLPSCLSELWAILSRRLGRRAFPGMDYPTPWKKFRQRHLKLSHRRARELDRHSAMNSCASSAKGFAGAGLVFGT
jgi:hypothetical protein